MVTCSDIIGNLHAIHVESDLPFPGIAGIKELMYHEDGERIVKPFIKSGR